MHFQKVQVQINVHYFDVKGIKRGLLYSKYTQFFFKTNVSVSLNKLSFRASAWANFKLRKT